MRPLAATLLCVVAFPIGASAHLGHTVQRAERYVKLDVAAPVSRLVISLSLGASETSANMREADTDDDGVVSDVERDTHLDAWVAGVLSEVTLRSDDERVTLRCDERFMTPTGPIALAPGTVETVCLFDTPSGHFTLHLDDEMPLAAVERTDVKITGRDGVEVLGVMKGRTQPPSFALGAREALSGLSVELRAPDRGLPSWAIGFGVVTAAIAACTVFLVGVLRRRRKAA